MSFVKRFPTYIKITNAKETLIENQNWSFKKKAIDYQEDRTQSIVEYFDCMINKTMWLKTKKALEEVGGSLLDIKVGEVITFDNYIRAYSDGSNDKSDAASYGFVWMHSDNKESLCEYVEGSKLIKPGTNSVGELKGAIDCLNSVYEYLVENSIDNIIIELCSDSVYTILGHTLHIPKQIKKGWRNTQNKPTANKEYWLELIDIASKIDSLGENVSLVFKWVKGHKLKAADTRFLSDDSYLEHLEIDMRKEDILNNHELKLSSSSIDILMNERCDILAKRAIGK